MTTYDGVMRSLEFSLERLGLDRVDILYAHDLDLQPRHDAERLQARLDEFMAGGYRALLGCATRG
jgi:D-threo-aldose 1-dehydrogenase